MNTQNKPFQVVKALALALAVVMLPLASKGASASASWSVAGTNSIIQGPGNITQITLTATGAVMFVKLLDMPTNTLTYVVGAYTNYTPTVYTNTATYTDILGNTVSNSYRYLTNIPTSVAQSTNNYRTIGTFVVPANDTVTIPYVSANPFVFGVGYTNVGGGSVTIQYAPYK